MNEGTNTLKHTKIQSLNYAFETQHMKETETFDEFYAKLSDIVNSSFNLGEPISENKIVKKILQSLFERFLQK